MHMALDSVFAEYDKTLFEKWDIFAIDMTYQKKDDSDELENILDRICYYGDFHDNITINNHALLTDKGGDNFIRQTVDYAKNIYGVDIVESVINLGGGDELALENAGSIFSDLEKLELPDLKLPKLPVIDDIFILSLLPENVSKKSIKDIDVPSKRELLKGDMILKEKSFEKICLVKYINDHYVDFLDEGEGDIKYEKEYLVVGKDTDEENLISIIRRILLMRLPVNLLLLNQDRSKLAQVEAWAAGLSVLFGVPLIERAVRYALLVAWAHAESSAEVRNLLKGGKIPFVKSNEDWNTEFSSIFEDSEEESDDAESGFDQEGSVHSKRCI